MTEVDGTVRTDDMAFATVLIVEGYRLVMERNHNQVIWVVCLEDVDGELQDIIKEYLAGECLVEPARFIREVRAVRQQMYRFLGVSHQDKATSVRGTMSAS